MGEILGIFTSKGGVPKLPVDSAVVNKLGLVIDDQANKKYHGGINRAVCILGYDVLRRLQEEGHPITPGSTGENILLSGFKLGIGEIIEIQDVKLEIVSAASPCYKISDSFLEGNFERMSNKKYPGDTRWYCRVLSEGEIKISSAIDSL